MSGIKFIDQKKIAYLLLSIACLLGGGLVIAGYLFNFEIWGKYWWTQYLVLILALVGWKIESNRIGYSIFGVKTNDHK